MAIAHPASTKPGTQNESEGQPRNFNADAGVELQVAPPAEVRAAASGGEVPAPGGTSSGSHLAGMSESDIKTIADKLQRLLDTVPENRPGGDRGVMRTAWVFRLQP